MSNGINRFIPYDEVEGGMVIDSLFFEMNSSEDEKRSIREAVELFNSSCNKGIIMFPC